MSLEGELAQHEKDGIEVAKELRSGLRYEKLSKAKKIALCAWANARIPHCQGLVASFRSAAYRGQRDVFKIIRNQARGDYGFNDPWHACAGFKLLGRAVLFNPNDSGGSWEAMGYTDKVHDGFHTDKYRKMERPLLVRSKALNQQVDGLGACDLLSNAIVFAWCWRFHGDIRRLDDFIEYLVNVNGNDLVSLFFNESKFISMKKRLI